MDKDIVMREQHAPMNDGFFRFGPCRGMLRRGHLMEKDIYWLVTLL